jgi:hypothetical protein
MKNILVVANKSWEVEPMLDSMTSKNIKPKELPFPATLNSPVNGKQNQPRAVFDFKDAENNPRARATVWCIEDVMDPAVSSSSSEEKWNKLPNVFGKEDFDITIAFGTAGFNDRYTSFNGSVVIGSEFFLYNAKPDNTQSKFTHELIGKPIGSNLPDPLKFFKLFDTSFKNTVESLLIPTPNNSCPKPKVLAASNYLALSNVNITNYEDYAWADEEGLASYHLTKHKSPIGSIETTHGIIRLASAFPTIFVSAITDRLTYFNAEVTPTQNYTASFNGGTLLSYLLPILVKF